MLSGVHEGAKKSIWRLHLGRVTGACALCSDCIYLACGGVWEGWAFQA